MILSAAQIEECRRDIHQAYGYSISYDEKESSKIDALCDMAASQHNALALLRELNDALAIPGWLQPRADAVLDRADIQFAAKEKTP